MPDRPDDLVARARRFAGSVTLGMWTARFAEGQELIRQLADRVEALEAGLAREVAASDVTARLGEALRALTGKPGSAEAHADRLLALGNPANRALLESLREGQ